MAFVARKGVILVGLNLIPAELSTIRSTVKRTLDKINPTADLYENGVATADIGLINVDTADKHFGGRVALNLTVTLIMDKTTGAWLQSSDAHVTIREVL